MMLIGVNIAILKDGQILLTRREDFDVWCMPGGSVDACESLAQAACREALEETGLQVKLTRLVGIYSRPQYQNEGSHIAVFAAEAFGGSLQPQAEEVLEIGYFASDALPKPMMLGQEQRISDVFSGAGGSVVWLQDAPWPFPTETTRQDIYRLRESTGLSRREFYLQYLAASGLQKEEKEV